MVSGQGQERVLDRKLRMGMVGGGRGAFIGAVHRQAAMLDGGVELVAGAFSSTPEKARASARDLYVSSDRAYPTWEVMVERESALPADERIDFVSIVTPNHLHYPVARTFVEAGFNVVLDKPMAIDSAQADQLVAAVDRTGVVFAVTYNYTGYPMVKQARHMVQEGLLGQIRKVMVDYPQGWLSGKLEATGHKQALWRTDPDRAGVGGAIGDIGTHAENLMSTITGLQIEAVCADLTAFVDGRPLDDDASVLLRFRNGAKGVLTVSQVATGEENALSISVWGDRAGLQWRQELPNVLTYRPKGEPAQALTRGSDGLCEPAQRATRLPAGHPEGFIEAFANLYCNVTDTMRARLIGREPTALERDFPTVRDGARGVRFIEKVVESSKSAQKWTPFT